MPTAERNPQGLRNKGGDSLKVTAKSNNRARLGHKSSLTGYTRDHSGKPRCALPPITLAERGIVPLLERAQELLQRARALAVLAEAWRP